MASSLSFASAVDATASIGPKLAVPAAKAPILLGPSPGPLNEAIAALEEVRSLRKQRKSGGTDPVTACEGQSRLESGSSGSLSSGMVPGLFNVDLKTPSSGSGSGPVDLTALLAGISRADAVSILSPSAAGALALEPQLPSGSTPGYFSSSALLRPESAGPRILRARALCALAAAQLTAAAALAELAEASAAGNTACCHAEVQAASLTAEEILQQAAELSKSLGAFGNCHAASSANLSKRADRERTQ